VFEALWLDREVLEKRKDYPASGTVSGLPERWKVRYTAPFSRDPAAMSPGAIRVQQVQWRKLSLMPIYEYRCSQCGNQLEALQKISDAPLTQCPACNQSGLVKQVSASSFRLKGGGWYETDFKTGKRRHGTQDADSGSAPATSSATAS
jgi:putative FmdB family regulatory protein